MAINTSLGVRGSKWEKEMVSKGQVIVGVLLVLLSSGDSGIVGGRQAIRDVKRNEEVQGLGEFSVGQFNSLRGGGRSGKLVFLKVVEAQVQVVSGLKYFMKVKARSEGGEDELYDSVVMSKPWLSHGGRKSLVSFSPSRHRQLLPLQAFFFST